MPIEDALLICLKRLRVSLSPVPLLTRVIQQHSDDVQQAAHHLQEEVEEAYSQTCDDKRRRSSDQIRAKQTKSRYRVPDVYLHQSAAHQTGTRATDTGKRLATDTAHCTSPNKGPNTIQHQTQSTDKTMERKKKKKERIEKHQKQQQFRFQHEQWWADCQTALTGSLVLDEEKLQAFLKRVLVHIKLDLDSEGKTEGQKERGSWSIWKCMCGAERAITIIWRGIN